MTSIPKSLEPFEKCPKVTLSDVLRNIPAIKRRTKGFGCCPFDTDDLIIKLLKGEMSLDDTLLQAILLDWIESEDYNKFLNLETGEFIYAKSAKRGNVVYATRKTKKRDALKKAIEGKVFYDCQDFQHELDVWAISIIS